MPNYLPVPPISQIRPSTAVSIILKQDQRTGRQVTGYVGQILTRGDHPRGVKVRLQDGRVGRVQAIISPDLVKDPSFSATAGEGGSSQQIAVDGGNGGARWANRRSGMERRSKGGDRHAILELPAEPQREYDLSAFIKEKKGKSRGRKGDEIARDEVSETRKEENILCCPVCGLFTGDERAVEWHVGTHFDA
ncbi:hypothetical protein K493DRAFT_316314 [Basidiobolus meristosporus CBS 931.73]|uniref:Uncharacterized protein n=1 Tax=Basidiobolus meristosporus CBS 931.73 TaxID=1314790 RepID=A0A1Y1Y4D2_9FUNG|nr:hypothetical protein K493DRAFT_322106 [Basidiobolus meristosporus CBS 931.73]ORX92892.1 hypothetical protein K493DRAFT_316314 [Basidiobolus meristosporus CBS 931.73]|eukprot:ORX63556.1 hypothetical protein K493DRAFT_322106 [Basidiobolus meristosporus CBS 931.73]